MKKVISTFSILAIFSCMTAFGQIKITDAKLGKGVENRVITEEASSFSVDSKVYCWVKTSGGTGDITFTWKSGSKSHTRTQNIGGDPWRTWAFMTAYSAGDWTVTVTDGSGAVLKEMSFKVQ